MLIYLGGPIDSVDKELAQGWRDRVSEILSQLGVMTFDPSRPYGKARTSGSVKSITKANRAILRVADGGLFYINGPTFGTVREIEYMKNIGREVMVVVGEEVSTMSSDLAQHIETYDLMLRTDLIQGCRDLISAVSRHMPEYAVSFGTEQQMNIFEDVPDAGDMIMGETKKDITQERESRVRYKEGESHQDFSARKAKEAGAGKPDLPEKLWSLDEKVYLFLKAYLIHQLFLGAEQVSLQSQYFGYAINDKREVTIEVVEEIATAKLVPADASNTG
jgi:nucleoside 2-deoxyribosyltransferase